MNDYSTTPAPQPAGSPTSAARSPGAILRSRLVWGLVALLVAAFLARLGAWQLSRAHEKTALAERIAERGAMPPLAPAEFAREPAAAEGQWERRIVLEGHWLPARTVWLANRTMDEFNGYFVLTPLQLADGDVVLVQRGFARGDPAAPQKVPPLATPSGPVRVEGHVAPWPAHRFELGRPANGPVQQNVDPAWVAKRIGTALRPAMVVEDANAGNRDDGLLRHWALPPGSAFTNYGYAAQWFAMSAAVLGLYAWVQFFRRAPAPESRDLARP